MTGIELGLNVHAVSGLTMGGNLTYVQSSLTLMPEDIDREYTGANHVQVFESGVFVNERREVEGLTRRPSLSANIHVSFQTAGPLALSLSSRFVGERDDVFYSENLGPFGALDRSEVSGYNITDISARYRLSNRVSLALQVENVFDTQYLELNGYRTRGRGVFLKAALNI
jgi:outer membrane cobalamin receptor